MSVRELWRAWVLLMMATVTAWLALQGTPSPEGSVAAAPHPSAKISTVAPPPRPVDPSSALAALSQSTLWGPLAPRPSSAASGPDSGAEPPKWIVSGYYVKSGKEFIIVSFEQLVQPSQHLKLGDKLPDGSRILKIEADRIRVRPTKVASPDNGASSPRFDWLPITPGLAEPPNGTR